MRRAFSAFVAALVVLSAVGVAAAAAGLAFTGDDAAPNPYVDEDALTKQVHDVAWDDPLQYEGDDGSLATLDATVNESADNPYSLTVTDIDFDDADEFPRKDSETDNSASALDASEWTKDMASSTGSATIADATTAPNVDALNLAVSGQSSGDTAVLSYSNVSLTSDVEKRYLQVAADVNSIGSSTDAVLRLNDSDGDYVEVTLANSTMDAASSTVVANSTTEGAVLQYQIGQLTTQGSGDGVMGELQSISVRVNDGDVDVDVSLLNAERMSMYGFGEQLKDTDSDDDLETVTIEEPTGTVDVHSLTTFGPALSNATIHGVSMPVQHRAADLAAEDVSVSFNESDKYPGYDYIAEINYRIDVESAYDLSHSGLALQQEQKWPSDRYLSIEIAEGTGDTAFDDVSSWTDVTSKVSSEGNLLTLDDTIQPGQKISIRERLRITEDDRSAMTLSGGAGAIMGGGGSGGLFGGIFNAFTGAIAGVLGFFGIKLRGS
ncbi:hypothetical protein [Halorhabdus salina]|uniref:hypothetical protein n=1 Tax=Halorhabdus salina TaxID=2750670 RepID=UPI0015EF4D90|nr:hypothetical protein [Halorhabdus salina]